MRTLISTEDLANRLGSPDLVVCDVRHDLRQAGRMGRSRVSRGPRARRASSFTWTATCPRRRPASNGRHPLPTPEAAAAVFGRLGIAAGKDVVVYDQGPGMYASRMWWMLRWLGFESVAVLDGGFAKWKAEGRPTATDIAQPVPANFAIRRVTPTVSAIGRRGEPGAARAGAHRRARTGALPRRDRAARSGRRPHSRRAQPSVHAQPRRGRHVQAAGVPARRIRGAAGRRVARARRPPMRFRRDRVPQPAGDGNRRVSAGTRLYPGSWSEWCSDPTRPIAVGP